MVALAEVIEAQANRPTVLPATLSREDKSRMKWVRINNVVLVDLFRNGQDGRFLKLDGLPADAILVDYSPYPHFMQNESVFRFWSSEFPVVPESDTMPELELWASLVEVEQVKAA